MSKWKSLGINLIAVAVLVGGLILCYIVISKIWDQFRSLDEKIAVALLTAATTIFISTLTVVLGRYFERKKDIESHFRSQKIKIYDEFLKEFFKLFHSDHSKNKPDDLVPFLREWQRKLIVWGGQDVLKAYIEWMGKLQSGEPDLKAMWMTEDFFRAIRKDLGHSSQKLPKGAFIRLILRDADSFIQLSKTNPNLTLAQYAELERKQT